MASNLLRPPGPLPRSGDKGQESLPAPVQATGHDARSAIPLPMSPAPADPADTALVARLAEASREFEASGADLERNCWMAVHRHVHGVPPSEYDIREVPEDLYLAVLACRRAMG